MKVLILTIACLFAINKKINVAAANITVDFFYTKTVQLNCSGNGNVQFYGYVDNVKNSTALTGGKYTVTDGVLTITDLRKAEMTVDFYSCESNGTQITNFTVLAHPYMYAQSKASTTVTENGMAEFTCELIVGYQQGQKITWEWLFGSDKSLLASSSKADQGNYVLEEIESGKKSKLTVKRVSVSDKGDFSCTAINGVGNYTQTITLRVKNTLAALWPFLGIVAEVIILCIILFVYEKKFANKGNAASADDREQSKNLMEKQSSNPDLKKRTAKA